MFDRAFPKLKLLFENDLEDIAGEMLAVGLITRRIATRPSFDAIIQGFYSGFSFLEGMEEIRDWCEKLFSAMRKVGGAFTVAVVNVKKQLNHSLRNKLGVQFNV